MLNVTHEKPHAFYPQFARKDGDPHVTHYCPGCGHGVLHKYIAEAIDDLGIQNQTILVSPVGCSVFAYYYLDVGNVQAAHGRAPAVATGIKRSRPDSVVIAYQGDGDLAAIGTAEIVHAANRGESITVFFVNNGIYGMTGGQMAPTTLLGQKTTTTPLGRDPFMQGYPLKICELLSSLEGPTYIERVALAGPKTNMKARQAVRKALRIQVEKRGFSLVEILSGCPTGWKMTPAEASSWIEQRMIPAFPLGVYRDISGSRILNFERRASFSSSEIVSQLELNSIEGDSIPEEEHQETLGFHSKGIKIAGFGGQGILSLGLILATAGMMESYHASWLPSYGPEIRGGTANCNVVLSRKEIGTPLVDSPDILIAMNGPSLVRFQDRLKVGGLVLYDSSLIPEAPRIRMAEAIGVPASRMAHELGESKAANLIMVGALMRKLPILRTPSIHRAIDEIISSVKMRELNKKALELGMQYHENSNWAK